MLGTLAGALAGYRGGWLDVTLMRIGDFVLVLPAIYVVLVLRAAMPLVLSTADVFWTLSTVLAVAAWPYPARGVRAIVAAERVKEYAEAAHAIGAGPWRILLRHLVPAAFGFLAVQATLLLPAFILAEATLSFVGLGFPEPTPSWGVMLQDAARVRDPDRRALAAGAGRGDCVLGAGAASGGVRLAGGPARRRFQRLVHASARFGAQRRGLTLCRHGTVR